MRTALVLLACWLLAGLPVALLVGALFGGETPDAITAASQAVRTYNDAKNLARHLEGLSNAGLAQLAAALQAEAHARGNPGAVVAFGAAAVVLEAAG